MWLQSKLSLKLKITTRNQQRMESQVHNNHADIMKTVMEMKEDMQAVKIRQDLVFRKQYIIDSTLAGARVFISRFTRSVRTRHKTSLTYVRAAIFRSNVALTTATRGRFGYV